MVNSVRHGNGERRRGRRRGGCEQLAFRRKIEADSRRQDKEKRHRVVARRASPDTDGNARPKATSRGRHHIISHHLLYNIITEDLPLAHNFTEFTYLICPDTGNRRTQRKLRTLRNSYFFIHSHSPLKARCLFSDGKWKTLGAWTGPHLPPPFGNLTYKRQEIGCPKVLGYQKMK